MPRHFTGLTQSLLDPGHLAMTKNFKNGRIWGEIQPLWSALKLPLHSRSYLLNMNFSTQHHKSQCKVFMPV